MALSPRHEHAARPIPAHPYRDSLLLHGALGIVIVVVSVSGDTGTAKGLAVGLGYFVLASAWSCWRFNRRIAAERTQSTGPDGA